MVSRARTATYQDVIDAPEHQVAELIDGELFLSPRPRPLHQHAASLLGVILGDAFVLGRSGPGGWRILPEVEIHLVHKKRVLVPDLSGWKLERRAEDDIDPEEVAVQVVPDWVCEALSPSTARFDRLRKLPLYAEHGVAWVWFLDPVQRLLEIYRLEKEGYLLAGVFDDGMKLRAPPFDAIELDLALLWWPEPKTAAEQPEPK